VLKLNGVENSLGMCEQAATRPLLVTVTAGDGLAVLKKSIGVGRKKGSVEPCCSTSTFAVALGEVRPTAEAVEISPAAASATSVFTLSVSLKKVTSHRRPSRTSPYELGTPSMDTSTFEYPIDESAIFNSAALASNLIGVERGASGSDEEARAKVPSKGSPANTDRLDVILAETLALVVQYPDNVGNVNPLAIGQSNRNDHENPL